MAVLHVLLIFYLLFQKNVPFQSDLRLLEYESKDICFLSVADSQLTLRR